MEDEEQDYEDEDEDEQDPRTCPKCGALDYRIVNRGDRRYAHELQCKVCLSDYTVATEVKIE